VARLPVKEFGAYIDGNHLHYFPTIGYTLGPMVALALLGLTNALMEPAAIQILLFPGIVSLVILKLNTFLITFLFFFCQNQTKGILCLLKFDLRGCNSLIVRSWSPMLGILPGLDVIYVESKDDKS